MKKTQFNPPKNKKQNPSLKDDKVFKQFFKNNQKPLISLLQSFLPLPKSQNIKEVKILDSLLTGSPRNKNKESVMDLRLQLDNQELVNVEMQICLKSFFKERVLFYWSKNYFSQLKEGNPYKLLHPTYSLIFCDFKLFNDEEKFYRSCSIREDDVPNPVVSDHLRLIFVELPKVKQKIENLFDFREAWCYLFNHLHEMGEQDRELFASRGKKMEELMDWTRPLTLEESEQIIAEAEEKNRRDRVAEDEYIFEQGLEKGLQQGLQKGKQEGLQQGLEKGMQAVALNMLKKQMELSVISEVTGFSIEELKKLKK